MYNCYVHIDIKEKVVIIMVILPEFDFARLAVFLLDSFRACAFF